MNEARTPEGFRICNFQLPESSGDPDERSWDRPFAAATAIGAIEANLAWLMASVTVSKPLAAVFFGLIFCAPISLLGAVVGLNLNVLLSKYRWSFHLACLSIFLSLFIMFLWMLSEMD